MAQNDGTPLGEWHRLAQFYQDGDPTGVARGFFVEDTLKEYEALREACTRCMNGDDAAIGALDALVGPGRTRAMQYLGEFPGMMTAIHDLQYCVDMYAADTMLRKKEQLNGPEEVRASLRKFMLEFEKIPPPS